VEKKQWSKPECERVKLVQEEAVLAHCKTTLGGGPEPKYACQHSGGACRGNGS
jgi:hypothetical protein